MEAFDASKDNIRYYVYILYSHKDKGFYIGFTTDLKKRLSQHARGEVKSTKIDVIYYSFIMSTLLINKMH